MAGLSAVILEGLSAVIMEGLPAVFVEGLSAMFLADWTEFFGVEVIVSRIKFEPQIHINVYF